MLESPDMTVYVLESYHMAMAILSMFHGDSLNFSISCQFATCELAGDHLLQYFCDFLQVQYSCPFCSVNPMVKAVAPCTLVGKGENWTQVILVISPYYTHWQQKENEHEIKVYNKIFTMPVTLLLLSSMAMCSFLLLLSRFLDISTPLVRLRKLSLHRHRF